MKRITEAFRKARRADFLLPDFQEESARDVPLPIGYGQTNSQPYTVRLMLEWLAPERGEKVLDVGSGSGWTAALLAHLVGPAGRVFAVEKVAELVRFGRENCQRVGIRNARFFRAGKELGLPQFAPYDRILVSASAEHLPVTLLNQLRVGGRIVIPIEHSVHVIDKIADHGFEDREYPGFAFVPLV